MKKITTLILSLLMLISLVSCDRSNNNESNESSQANISATNEESEQAESNEILDDNSIDDSYDFVKEPFKNKDGIIDLSENVPYGEVIENEELRQELIPEVKKIYETINCLWGGYILIDENEMKEKIDEDTAYYVVLPEYATKEELIGYFKRSLTDKYISKSISKPLEEYLFGGDMPYYKMIDNTLCALFEDDCYCSDVIFPDGLKILKIQDNAVDTVMVGGLGCIADFYLQYMHFIRSDDYGWRLDSSEYTNDYNPAVWYFDYLFIKNAPKLNLIFSGSKPVLVDEKKVSIEYEGIQFEQIEKFLTIKEMTDYFNDIFTEDIAKQYIQTFIDVYYEKDGKLYRKVGAMKAVMPEYIPDSIQCQICEGEILGYCNYKINGVVHEQQEVKIYCKSAVKNDMYLDRLTELKIAVELPLQKID